MAYITGDLTQMCMMKRSTAVYNLAEHELRKQILREQYALHAALIEDRFLLRIALSRIKKVIARRRKLVRKAGRRQ